MPSSVACLIRELSIAVVALCLSSASAQQPPHPQLAPIPAGEYRMGSDDGATWERPPHAVNTPAFEIGARPVTNAEFRAFHPGHVSAANNADQAPVTDVSWRDAVAYCRWLSDQTGVEFFLPSEAWWERAARGGLEGNKYPWGDEPLAAGAAAQPNAFGVVAVSGNLWEWVSDWYAADYYAASPRDNPTGPSDGDYRVLRGGGFRGDPASATCYTRGSARPETKNDRITFRVAKAAAPGSTTLTRARSLPPSQPKPRTPPAAPAAGLHVASIAFDADARAVRIATSSTADYKHFALSGPDRIVVDLPGAVLEMRPSTGAISVARDGVARVRYSQNALEPPVLRVVVDLQTPRSYRIEANSAELLIRLQ